MKQIIIQGDCIKEKIKLEFKIDPLGSWMVIIGLVIYLSGFISLLI